MPDDLTRIGNSTRENAEVQNGKCRRKDCGKANLLCNQHDGKGNEGGCEELNARHSHAVCLGGKQIDDEYVEREHKGAKEDHQVTVGKGEATTEEGREESADSFAREDDACR
ncbi:MAG: hypothetical protein IIV78_01225 [Oscillospiraceae bacterium]|nr:hypothetical protein [Oscillospiraceae bacterium]